jgi:hypothetical protein
MNKYVLCTLCIIIFIVGCVMLIMNNHKLYQSIEQFGFSNGTLVQLATSHVPRNQQEVEDQYRQEWAQVQHDLYDMTGSYF